MFHPENSDFLGAAGITMGSWVSPASPRGSQAAADLNPPAEALPPSPLPSMLGNIDPSLPLPPPLRSSASLTFLVNIWGRPRSPQLVGFI